MAIYKGNYLSGRVGNAVHYERGRIRLPDEIQGRVHLYCFFKSRGRPEYSDNWHFTLPGTSEERGRV